MFSDFIVYSILVIILFPYPHVIELIYWIVESNYNRCQILLSHNLFIKIP